MRLASRRRLKARALGFGELKRLRRRESCWIQSWRMQLRSESLREAVEGFERDRRHLCAHPFLQLDRVVKVEETCELPYPFTVTHEGICPTCGYRRREQTRSLVRFAVTHAGSDDS